MKISLQELQSEDKKLSEEGLSFTKEKIYISFNSLRSVG